jgi:hypothetical protein
LALAQTEQLFNHCVDLVTLLRLREAQSQLK